MWFWKLFFLCLELVHVFEGLSPGRFNQWAYRPGRTFDWTITNTSHRNVEKNTRLRIRGCSSLCRFQKGHWQCFSFYLVYETQDIKILSALTDLYFDVILLSLSYGLKLVLWGSCCNSEILQSLERLHYRAARLILNLPNDMESCQVLKQAQWCNLYSYFKPIFFICIHKAYHEKLPRLNTCYMKDSLRSKARYSGTAWHANIPCYGSLEWKLRLLDRFRNI